MHRPHLITGAVISALAFAAVPAAAQTAPLVPDPADVVAVGAGSFQTGSPPDGQSAITLNAGVTDHRDGSNATVTLLGSGRPPASGVGVSVLSGTTTAQATAGGTTLGVPGWTGIQGLTALPLTLPRLPRR